MINLERKIGNQLNGNGINVITHIWDPVLKSYAFVNPGEFLDCPKCIQGLKDIQGEEYHWLILGVLNNTDTLIGSARLELEIPPSLSIGRVVTKDIQQRASIRQVTSSSPGYVKFEIDVRNFLVHPAHKGDHFRDLYVELQEKDLEVCFTDVRIHNMKLQLETTGSPIVLDPKDIFNNGDIIFPFSCQDAVRSRIEREKQKKLRALDSKLVSFDKIVRRVQRITEHILNIQSHCDSLLKYRNKMSSHQICEQANKLGLAFGRLDIDNKTRELLDNLTSLCDGCTIFDQVNREEAEKIYYSAELLREQWTLEGIETKKLILWANEDQRPEKKKKPDRSRDGEDTLTSGTCPNCRNIILPSNKYIKCFDCQQFFCETCESWYRSERKRGEKPLCNDCYEKERLKNKQIEDLIKPIDIITVNYDECDIIEVEDDDYEYCDDLGESIDEEEEYGDDWDWDEEEEVIRGGRNSNETATNQLKGNKFPIIFVCPDCGRKSRVNKSGFYKCPFCGVVTCINESGEPNEQRDRTILNNPDTNEEKTEIHILPLRHGSSKPLSKGEKTRIKQQAKQRKAEEKQRQKAEAMKRSRERRFQELKAEVEKTRRLAEKKRKEEKIRELEELKAELEKKRRLAEKNREEEEKRELEELMRAPITPHNIWLKRRDVSTTLGIPTSITNSIGIKLILIPPGTFRMGAIHEYKAPPHEVIISKPFYLGTYQITQAQWLVFMKNRSKFKYDDHPVEKVSWNDCQVFIDALNRYEGTKKYRLPTEAEWEYSCRAGSVTKYHFGDNTNEIDNYVWYKGNSNRKTHPVGQLKPNELGLYDILGNVWEWCSDWLDVYPPMNVTDPIGPTSGRERIIRGGSWYSQSDNCTSVRRQADSPHYKADYLGFRLAMSP